MFVRTEGRNAAARDVRLAAMSRGYPFGIAVFDNTQINQGVFTLTFK